MPPMEHLFDYGCAGAGMIVLATIAIIAIRGLINVTRENNEVLRGLTAVIEKCKGPAHK